MAYDIRKVKTMTDLIGYFSQNLRWNIDVDDFDDIEDISYDFEAEDIGLKEEAFAKISSLRQLQPLVDGQRWGIFCVEFDSDKFEVTALRKILSGLVPKRRNSADHAVWDQKDLMFICNWGKDNNRTIGIAHFEDKDSGLPQIKMISCAPAMEDFTQIKVFEDRLAQLAFPRNTRDIDAWRESWASAFVSGYRQAIHDSVTLTVQLAAEAQNIRNRILDILEVESRNGYVHLLYEKFRNTLIHDMTESQFADMYAQTVVYGLFSARCMDKTQGNFSAEEAIDCIPNTNPFLKSLMKECLGSENNTKLSFDELEISNVVELLRNTRIEAIIQDFNRQTGGGREDPVIHFYEEFLTAYDKAQKVQRGVYYTPQPVVNFMVRAVDSIIKDQFGLRDGLASEEMKKIKVKRKSYRKRAGQGYKEVEELVDVPAIQVLDPATGTGTFLRQTILQIYENFKAKHKGLRPDQLAAEWNKYVPEQLLPRLNGFELMMAPYAVAHMKLAMILKDTGYDFSSDSRLKVYLTNSLEEPGSSDEQMSFFDDPLAIESIEANGVKKNGGINVLIGNPPYSTESSNKGEWISDLMELYKKEADGRTKLQEKNSKPLNDDYIKFIRYGQHILDNSSNGILAFINPHGFMDGPIYRGMRTALMKSFDAIYLIDLHGNTNRQETAPDGGKDENVFDIKQGVCIVILVKQSGIKKKAKVYRTDIYGLRDEKYKTLQTLDFSRIAWSEILPSEPLNLFCFENTESKTSYESGIAIRDLFNVNGTGVLTKRDQLCVHFTRESAFTAAEDIATKLKDYVIAKYSIPEDVRDWKYEWAKADVIRNGLDRNKVIPITYRPFDDRFVYYTGESRGFMGWPVYAVMQHLLNDDNIALVTARSNKAGNSTHFFVSRNIVEYKCGERTTNSSVFPLYHREDGSFKKKVNFQDSTLRTVEKKLGLHHSETEQNPEKYFSAFNLFAYIYAVLYAPSFRSEYKDFLNRDFPIIPYPMSKEQFWNLVHLGSKLISVHLLEEEVDSDQIRFIGNDYTVAKADYKNGRVSINTSSFFEGVDDDSWNFIVGGYQPCQRWLKERKKYTLTEEDIKHYIRFVSAIRHTIDLMKVIDSNM